MRRQISTIGFDKLDRAHTVTYSNTTGDGPVGYTYDYDPEGNAFHVGESLSVTGQSAPQTRNWYMQYDARNRMYSYSDPLGHNIGYGFDAANNIKTLTDAAGHQTTYGYDAMNRVSTVTTGSEQMSTVGTQIASLEV